jgi:hypothetical protein
VYWSQVDECAKVRVYREDQGHKEWDVLAENREQLGWIINEILVPYSLRLAEIKLFISFIRFSRG